MWIETAGSREIQLCTSRGDKSERVHLSIHYIKSEGHGRYDGEMHSSAECGFEERGGEDV